MRQRPNLFFLLIDIVFKFPILDGVELSNSAKYLGTGSLVGNKILMKEGKRPLWFACSRHILGF
uniref:Uncharacterized protein n=1 Tax=Megaselia scalaris TaxID=36166 RepID=T1H0A3_MEGSC